ncbi:hypothetical protein [Leuconostoc mesenteroides]|uniref:hypothetical protein n=1 Tax=Leuconostoc mesenteroides TaxID=1245 RepID=UPI001CBB722F|nr:hypothetical protein [Leuconostoc mesenteroides]
MLDYTNFNNNLNSWKRKPIFWIILLFIWPLFYFGGLAFGPSMTLKRSVAMLLGIK